ncbi:hypothetical protein [Shouchella lonarensis]|uniref:Uncharacterized protein n=1 Tax=Shouchella lonarensis TaxID=1464122 RepID=A0A1G6J5R1_9BACI|nr:hypothetical protein [Shouchella lonarensis]SDC14080.1 hypothetical protein SAMN05421737_105263 [Shouchella lonarensis]
MIEVTTATHYPVQIKHVQMIHQERFDWWDVVQFSFTLDPAPAPFCAPGAQVVLNKQGVPIEWVFQEERCDEPTFQLEEQEVQQLVLFWKKV